MKLALNHIHKQYGSHTVLKFDQWEMEHGIHWLKGGNGTGKTTLFRIISGQTPFHGQVLLNGIDLKKEPIIFRSKISYAAAEPQYPLFITGGELINFYASVLQTKPAEVALLTSLFEMKNFLNQKIGGYSSGMLKKLSLICAFLGDVDLYILDEPLITIDANSAFKLYHLINEKATQGKSFLLSSHQEIDSQKLTISTVFEIQQQELIKC